jgi:hypothetical protein
VETGVLKGGARVLGNSKGTMGHAHSSHDTGAEVPLVTARQDARLDPSCVVGAIHGLHVACGSARVL